MIMSIRTYLNFVAIEDAIKNVQFETTKTQEEIDYAKSFLIPYLSSEYAEYFLSHENSVLFPGEVIIRFEELSKKAEVKEDVEIATRDDYLDDAKDSWDHFWSERIRKVH